MSGSSGPEYVWSSSSRRSRRRLWNTSPSLRQLHLNEDVLKGAPSLDEEETMTPRRLMRLEHEDTAEVPKMDKLDMMGRKGSPKGRKSLGMETTWNNRSAHWSEANGETWHEPEEYHGGYEYEEHYDEHGYMAHPDESEQPTEWDYVEDEDAAVALVAMAECDHDETPADGFDDLPEAAQQLYVGYVAAGHKGKTKGFKGKDKGKGKGKHVFRTQLSVQDRVKRLAELKARSKCLRCGSTGHWAGDPVCKFPSKGKNKPGVGYLAISDEESSAGEYGVLHVRSRQEKEHAAFITYRTPVSRPPSAGGSAGGSADSGDFSMVSVSDKRKDRARRTRVPASREVKACLMGQITSSRLVNMLVRLTIRFCISTLVTSRSHSARVWQTFWIGPLTTMRLMAGPMRSFHACCPWKCFVCCTLKPWEARRVWETAAPKSPTCQVQQMNPLHRSGEQCLHSGQDMPGLWTPD